MEEVDNDDLMQNSDEEWMTENEEPCVPSEKQYFVPNALQPNLLRSKIKFIGLGFLLVVSSLFLLICLPMYSRAVNIGGDAYNIILFLSTFTFLILLMLTVISKKCFPIQSNNKLFNPPIEFKNILMIGIILALSSLSIIFALDQNKVMCHIQDPIKGIILVFSLVFYFFFCRKLMGLQRIFSCTTIIVGLFIAVDYGLCDEFRCRGYERETREGDAGEWPTHIHALWTAIYVGALALYATHFTMLERCLVPVFTRTQMYTSISSSFLATVSRIVATSDTAPLTSTPPTRIANRTKYEALPITLWIHSIVWIFALGLSWTDMVPGIGKSNSIAEFWNYTSQGLMCHFKIPQYVLPTHETNLHDFDKCSTVAAIAWPFLLVYVIFSVTYIHFLIVSQSAVFTVAMIVVALPLSGIWWSLFELPGNGNDLLLWAPAVTGEFICALLGLPIVFLGIILLCKSHFKEITEMEIASSIDTSVVTDHDYSSASTRLA